MFCINKSLLKYTVFSWQIKYVYRNKRKRGLKSRDFQLNLALASALVGMTENWQAQGFFYTNQLLIYMFFIPFLIP